jgi:4-hydroxybenzoate polyprenyltransferase
LAKLIVVDLDESLVECDLLLEGMWQVIRNNPGKLPQLGRALVTGSKLELKTLVVELSSMDATLLPFNAAIMEYLIASKANGSVLILVTASHENWAYGINDHLQIFDQVFGSSIEHGNLKGNAKVKLLEDKFPSQEFTYIGDSMSDIPVWDWAKEVVFAGKSSRTKRLVERRYSEVKIIESKRPGPADWFNQLRIRQWAKNLLVLLPMILALSFSQERIVSGLAAFLAFGFIASSSYILNDLLDIQADRQHPDKRSRPIASGLISIRSALVWMVGLAAVGLVLAFTAVGVPFLLLLIVYSLLNSTYSLVLKRLELIDVVVLSVLYLLRIVAGGVATATLVSHWLMVFAFFVFLSLGLLKRYSELILNQTQLTYTDIENSRGYQLKDTPLIGGLGIAFGVLSSGMLALYIDQTIQSPGVILWLLVPLWSLWIMKPWLLAHRGLLASDPVEYAVRNPFSLSIMLLLAAVFYTANLFSI